ncbi:MAG: hypothetical protein JOZ72_19980 [Alphaproteobacteria bacterium]|nr:hypothetical protein [Alphaproteobacteria bacterium]
MSGRPNYGPEALSRIERLGEKSIAAFFNEVPRELLKVVTGHLPPLAGFRPGTSTAVQRQLQSLAYKLATHRTGKTFSRSPEETALYGLWRAWSLSQISESATVRELLDDLDEEDDDAAAAPDKAEQMSTALKALAGSGTCAREILERFIAFSPFETVDGFLELVRGARTAAEIKRDTTLLDLPDRLHKDEARLQLLETKLDASDRNTSLMRSEIDDLSRVVSEVRTAVQESHAAIVALRTAGEASAEHRKAHEEALARLTHATDRLTGRIAVNEKQAEIAATAQGALERELGGAASVVTQLSEQLAEHTARAHQLAEDLHGQMEILKNQSERLAEFDTLVARIDQVESLVLDLSEAKPSVPPLPGPSAATGAVQVPLLEIGSLAVERLRLETGLSVKPLRTAADILGSLEAALTDAGLKKSTAAAFAEEILAAATSEQVVFFRGGFAVDLARKCALSLCGTEVFRVAIPLGITDPSLFRARLNQYMNGAPTVLSAVVMEGVNNSPLDLLRDVLLDQVTLRVGSLARQAPAVVIACLADGAGAFPIDPSYLELGPIFDLEAMDWRRLRREKLPVLGSVARSDWEAFFATWDGKAVNYEEALQGAQRLAPKRNARVEANVVRAFSAITAMRRTQGPTPLQSITFGWLVPYWQSLAAKVADIDAQIDGGKCDAATPDDRLKILLAEYRSASTGGST